MIAEVVRVLTENSLVFLIKILFQITVASFESVNEYLAKYYHLIGGQMMLYFELFSPVP